MAEVLEKNVTQEETKDLTVYERMTDKEKEEWDALKEAIRSDQYKDQIWYIEHNGYEEAENVYGQYLQLSKDQAKMHLNKILNPDLCDTDMEKLSYIMRGYEFEKDYIQSRIDEIDGKTTVITVVDAKEEKDAVVSEPEVISPEIAKTIDNIESIAEDIKKQEDSIDKIVQKVLEALAKTQSFQQA